MVVNIMLYYLIVTFYMFYKVFYLFQLFLEFWLSSVLLPGDLLAVVLLPGALYCYVFYCLPTSHLYWDWSKQFMNIYYQSEIFSSSQQILRIFMFIMKKIICVIC